MNFLFDAAAQMPEVNSGIEQGMKLSEEGRRIAMARDKDAADILEYQRRQADMAGLRPSPMGDMPGLPRNPDYFSRPASPSATQVAAAAPAPAAPAAGLTPSTAVAPPNMIPAPAGGYGPIIPESGLSGPVPVVHPPFKVMPLLPGQNPSILGRNSSSSTPQDRTEDEYRKRMTGGTPSSAAGLNAGSPEAINNLVDYIIEKNTGFATSKDREPVPEAVSTAPDKAAAKGAPAPANTAPAAQTLAGIHPTAGLTPATVPGKPAAGQPLTEVASAGLAAPGSPSAAVAAEGATRFNMEIDRAMNTRAVVAQNAKQQYDQNMFLANKAERYAQIARSVQNMDGYDTHMDNAIKYRNQATAAHTAAVNEINKIDAAVQTNVLGFAVDRLTNLNDTTFISQVISKQTDQTTAIRESGTLGADGKPTYNMWIQGKSGAWTAVSDAKSGKVQTFSANEIAVRALSASSEAYRAAQSSSNVEQAKATAELGRELSKLAGKSYAEAQAEIMKLVGSGEYVHVVDATSGDITYIPKFPRPGATIITLKKVPDKIDGKPVGTVTTAIIP